MERRRAADGCEYTREEFWSHYGNAAEWYWQRAQCDSGDTTTLQTRPLAGIPTQPSPTEPQPDDATGADTPGGAPRVEAPSPRTFEGLRARAARRGHGGKHACAVQRALREWCLAQDPVQHVVDLTRNELPAGVAIDGDFDWRDLLTSMEQNVVRGMMDGSELQAFRFRLLEGTLDHNWSKHDSGERHVFEVALANGTATHLHFHKNGKVDHPATYLDGADTPVPRRGPDGPTRDNAPDHELGGQISKTHAAMAAENLLYHAHGLRAGAVRITTGIGFDWMRWMANVVQGQELRGPGVTEAYVVRRALDQDPEYMFHRADGATVAMKPSAQRYNASQRRHGIDVIAEEDQDVHTLLRNAPVAVQQWQRLRRPPPQRQ